VSIVLMTVDHRTRVLQPAREVLMLIAYPIQYLVDLPSSAGHWASDKFGTHASLIAEIERLREEHLRLKTRLLTYESLEGENARLRGLLASAERFREHRILVAELLSIDMDPFRQKVVINKGETQGVYEGQPILDANGVMGQVTDVDPVSATAILISDPSHAIPVQINRNGVRTLAVGTGQPDRLVLPHIPANTDILAGDVASTSGLGGLYPSDYPVAEITEVERLPGEPFARVSARPLARLDRSREVLLVWWNLEPSGDIDPEGDSHSGPGTEEHEHAATPGITSETMAVRTGSLRPADGPEETGR